MCLCLLDADECIKQCCVSKGVPRATYISIYDGCSKRLSHLSNAGEYLELFCMPSELRDDAFDVFMRVGS